MLLTRKTCLQKMAILSRVASGASSIHATVSLVAIPMAGFVKLKEVLTLW